MRSDGVEETGNLAALAGAANFAHADQNKLHPFGERSATSFCARRDCGRYLVQDHSSVQARCRHRVRRCAARIHLTADGNSCAPCRGSICKHFMRFSFFASGCAVFGSPGTKFPRAGRIASSVQSQLAKPSAAIARIAIRGSKQMSFAQSIAAVGVGMPRRPEAGLLRLSMQAVRTAAVSGSRKNSYAHRMQHACTGSFPCTNARKNLR